MFFFVAGDLNLRFPDKPLVHARSAVEQFKDPKYARGAKLLLNSLRFSRIEHDQFTHYNSALQHLNDIDHVFISAPGWLQALKRVQVTVEQPEVLFSKGLSDHGALTCRFPSSKIPSSSQPIPPWVAKLPNFSIFLGQLVNASKLHQLLPEHALMEYKKLIREAARLARNDYCSLNRDSPTNAHCQPCSYQSFDC